MILNGVRFVVSKGCTISKYSERKFVSNGEAIATGGENSIRVENSGIALWRSKGVPPRDVLRFMTRAKSQRTDSISSLEHFFWLKNQNQTTHTSFFHRHSPLKEIVWTFILYKWNDVKYLFSDHTKIGSLYDFKVSPWHATNGNTTSCFYETYIRTSKNHHFFSGRHPDSSLSNLLTFTLWRLKLFKNLWRSNEELF